MSCHSISGLRQSYNYTCSLGVSFYSFLLYSFTYQIYLCCYFLFISSHITNMYTYLYLYISNLYLFRSPVGVTELIPIRRYLYTYLYFYLSYTCIYLILYMNNYDYHIILCMAGFLTQWVSIESKNTLNGVQTKEL